MQTTTSIAASGITFKDYFHRISVNRKWLMGSVLGCLLLATGYLLMKNPMYERSAQIMIKEDVSPSSKLTAGLSMIQGMGGLFGGSSNVSNELIAMKTPANIMEVVNRLHLDYNYTTRPCLRKLPLYGEALPVKVFINGLKPNDEAGMKIELKKGSVKIYKLKKGKETFEQEYQGKVNSVFHSPIGLIAITPTAAYTGKEDETIQLNKVAAINMVDNILKKLEAGITEELGSVIDLTYQDAVPERAEDILNMIIKVYNEKWMVDENTLNTTTTRFIDNRIAEITAELGKAENTITTYKSQHNLPDVTETTKLAMENSTKMSSELATLRGQREAAHDVERFLNNHSNANQTLPVNLLSNDKVLSTQIEEYNKLQLERNRIAENSNTGNSIVQGMEKQLANLRASIKAALSNTIRQADIQIANYGGLKGENDARVKASPVQAKFLLSAERQQKIEEQLYIFMLQKREENILSQAFTPYKTRILSPPMGGLKPVKPNTIAIIFGALLIGLILPLGWIFAKMNVECMLQEEA